VPKVSAIVPCYNQGQFLNDSNLRTEVDRWPSELQRLRQQSQLESDLKLEHHGTRKISIVVPVYFNEQSLAHLFEALVNIETRLLEKNVEMELIFVDDGSGDGSLKELLKIKQRRESTRVIKLTKNFGSVHASKTGFQFVTGDCFMILAADLQEPPELILSMVDKWLLGAKFIICKRIHRGDPPGSKLFSYLFYKLVRFFVIADYPSRGYDVALMDHDMLPYLRNSSKNINPPLFAYWLGFQPEVILYERQRRVHGKSRWTFSKRVKFFLDSLLGFSVFPIRLISMIGFFVSLASFSYGSTILINGLLGNTVVLGFATIVTILSFLLGLIIIMLGVIGEYIWRIFDEINKRPETVIDEIY
jgi:glycosyltransferase involved in cell wall biosynthesis